MPKRIQLTDAEREQRRPADREFVLATLAS